MLLKYGDAGADTLRHIAEYCLAKRPSGALKLPNLTRLGLNQAAIISSGKPVPGLAVDIPVTGAYGCAEENSLGKDTLAVTGEIAGVPAMFDLGYFPPEMPSFPEELLENLLNAVTCPAYWVTVMPLVQKLFKKLGEEHEKTGKRLLYTSAAACFKLQRMKQVLGWRVFMKFA